MVRLFFESRALTIFLKSVYPGVVYYSSGCFSVCSLSYKSNKTSLVSFSTVRCKSLISPFVDFLHSIEIKALPKLSIKAEIPSFPLAVLFSVTQSYMPFQTPSAVCSFNTYFLGALTYQI